MRIIKIMPFKVFYLSIGNFQKRRAFLSVYEEIHDIGKCFFLIAIRMPRAFVAFVVTLFMIFVKMLFCIMSQAQ